MSQEKGILGQIIEQQSKLDKRVLRERDLFNDSNEVDLTANFSTSRKKALTFSYISLRAIIKHVRKVGAKWWKNLDNLTEEDIIRLQDELVNGIGIDDDFELSNLSMKNIAIIQELIELEDAVKEGKQLDDIHDEFIDVLHFVVSEGIDLGISSEEMVKKLYERKNKINHQRIDNNY